MSKKKLKEVKKPQGLTPDEIEAKQNEAAMAYITAVVSLSGLQGMQEIDSTKKIFTTTDGGKYLLQFVYLEGAPINCQGKKQ